jgi:RHS repeat-associated protein
MVYDYDLISGKVNQVAYQPGFTDEFYHRYTYDAENRITDVETSHDGWIWEKDARYSFYKNGLLAREILGQQQVQGLDYAYTLQGRLKGVNSTSINDGTYDMGGDGRTGAGLNPVARDVFGFSLNYFGSDYKPIGGTNPFAAIAAPSPITTSGQDLFNGNIGAMAVNIPKLGDAHLYRYRYDQLNRIVAMDAFTGLNSSTNVWTPSVTDNYKERVSYDPNGNILTYLRNATTAGGNPLTMDNMTYGYNLSGGKLVNNRLRHVKDAVSSGNYSEGIDNQGDDNYTYDQIGNLTADAAEGISSITWNVYGKIAGITKTGTSIAYTYDVTGNRITKAVTSGGNTKTTVYVRDASGNVMSLYDQATSSAHLVQEEAHLYGSSRLGIFNVKRDVNSIVQVDHLDNIATFTRGNKFFELGNHLGNVLATVTDTKTETDSNTDGLVDYYTANVISANDYYPFGMMMPGRKFTAASSYRYGFNGKENDNDVKGEGNQQDYGMRIYDPRLGRFLSVDPITDDYPELTPYQFASNRPIDGIDLDGLEYSETDFESIKAKAETAIKNLGAGRAGIVSRGISNALINANTIGISDGIGGTDNLDDYEDEYDREAYLQGRIVGDCIAALQGFIEMNAGAAAVNAGGGMALTGVGTVVGGGTAVAGAAVGLHGTGVVATATSDIVWAIKKLAPAATAVAASDAASAAASKPTVEDNTNQQATAAQNKSPEATQSNTATNGNSRTSNKTQHGYRIKDTKNKDVNKYGVSGEKLNKNGTSPRANRQVSALNKKAGYQRYKPEVMKKNIQGKGTTSARDRILKWEQGKNRAYKKSNSSGNQPVGNKLPRIQ